MLYRSKKYTVSRRVRASSSPEILQAGAVKGLKSPNVSAVTDKVHSGVVCTTVVSKLLSLDCQYSACRPLALSRYRNNITVQCSLGATLIMTSATSTTQQRDQQNPLHLWEEHLKIRRSTFRHRLESRKVQQKNFLQPLVC